MATSSDEARRIPLSEPMLGGNELAYLRECVESGWVSTAGPFVGRFEAAVAGLLGGGVEAVATASGTAALHLALIAAGVGRDDEVLVPALTFIAPANAVRYVGAHPVFVDVDPATWQMDPALVAGFLDRECDSADGRVVDRVTGRRVAAVLPVDLLGHPADMDAIVAAARRHGLPVVEDATESLTASYRGRPVGTLGDIACLSFNGNKLATCGGGGMVVTARAEWAARVRHLANQAKSDAHAFVHDEVGFNYRLTSIQAALGLAQIERIDALAATRRRIASRYAAMARAVPGLSFMPEANWARSIFWLSTVLVDRDAFGMDRTALGRELARGGIETRPLWQPLHRSPAHAGARTLGGAVAEAIHARALCLPSSCTLVPDDQERVVAAVSALAARW